MKGNNQKKTKAESLAEFIADNWHYCPIASGVGIPEDACSGWGGDKCAKCIANHADQLNATD